MPEARAAGGAGVVQGRLYVAGGVGPHGLATTTLVFDPAEGRWRIAPGPPTPREHLGVAGFGDGLYVMGGRTGGIGSNLSVAEVLRSVQGAWETLPDLPTARGGVGAAATTNGWVVVAGGESRLGTFDEVEAYHVDTGTWVPLPPLPTARHGVGVAAVGTTVYVMAGGTEPGFSFSVANEAIDLGRLRP